MQIAIPAQQVLFDKAKVAISVTGGGGRSGDLGIDDFQMVTGACPQPNTEICSKSGQYTINGFYLLHVSKCKVLSNFKGSSGIPNKLDDNCNVNMP